MQFRKRKKISSSRESSAAETSRLFSSTWSMSLSSLQTPCANVRNSSPTRERQPKRAPGVDAHRSTCFPEALDLRTSARDRPSKGACWLRRQLPAPHSADPLTLSPQALARHISAVSKLIAVTKGRVLFQALAETYMDIQYLESGIRIRPSAKRDNVSQNLILRADLLEQA